MATIAEKMEGSDRLQRRVEQLMEVETNPWTTWSHWMGAAMKDIHDDLSPSFLRETFELFMRYRGQSKDLRQQQAP